MTRHHVSFDDAADLLEGLGPIRYIDPATGIDEFFYLKKIHELIPFPLDDDEYPGYEYEDAEYVRLTYPVPGPEGDEMGRICIEECGSSEIQLTIERDTPFKREHNYHWKQVCLFFERYKQLLDQLPSIDITISSPAPIPRPHLQPSSPTVLHLLADGGASELHEATDSTAPSRVSYREITQVIFYGTPAEFSLVITACAHSLTQRQGDVLFEMRSIVTPDIPLLEVWIHQQTIAGTILGNMLVQRLPGSRSRLSVLAAEAQYAALRDVWCLVRDELVQQGWIDAPGAEPIDPPADGAAPPTQPGIDPHMKKRSTDDPASRRETDHWAYKRAKRKQIVTEYRAARQRGEVANKGGWASKHGITGRTLLKYEKEFPEETE
jgi:hypothetical protein